MYLLSEIESGPMFRASHVGRQQRVAYEAEILDRFVVGLGSLVSGSEAEDCDGSYASTVVPRPRPEGSSARDPHTPGTCVAGC